MKHVEIAGLYSETLTTYGLGTVADSHPVVGCSTTWRAEFRTVRRREYGKRDDRQAQARGWLLWK